MKSLCFFLLLTCFTFGFKQHPKTATSYALNNILLKCTHMPYMVQKGHKSVKLKDDRAIASLLEKFSDSNRVKKVLGKDFELNTVSRIACGMGNSYSMHKIEMNYAAKGIKVSIGQSNKQPFRTIDLDSNSNWNVKGIYCNKSTFADLTEPGEWQEASVDKGKPIFFAFTTDWVRYWSFPVNQSIIDSLKLDSNNSLQMQEYFKNLKIKSIELRDNRMFMKRK